MHNWNDSLKGVLFGALTGIAVGLGGFILTEIPKTHAMGGVVFLLVPFAAGVAITVVSHDLGRISAAVLLATVGSLAILIAMKMETPVCAMMAFPLLFVGLLAGVGLGYALGYLFRKLMGRFGGNHATFTSIILLAMPLLVFAGHRLEVSNPIQARRQMVISTIRIHADPSQVWADLQSFDSLSGDKPFLMYVGLPIPVRCVLEGSGRGAKRTCYFDHGPTLKGVVVTQGYVAVANEDVLFPSLGINADGNGVIAFTLAGNDYFPSAAYVDVIQGFALPFVHVAGAGQDPDDGFTIYPAEGGNGVGRWGDYSAAVADGDRIWMASEYIPKACSGLTLPCRTSLANWGTFFATVRPFGF